MDLSNRPQPLWSPTGQNLPFMSFLKTNLDANLFLQPRYWTVLIVFGGGMNFPITTQKVENFCAPVDCVSQTVRFFE